MKEWFSKKFDELKHKDKTVLGKWGCLLGAGLLTLVAGLADQRIKDKRFEMELHDEIKKVAEQCLENKS